MTAPSPHGWSAILKRHPRRVVLGVAVALQVLLVAAVEIGLSLFAPTAIPTIGRYDTDNGRLYGWGFAPDELLWIVDPDTSEIYPSRTNGRGWRDRERTEENTKDAFRIVVIGDSNVFGHIVPDSGQYTRILEDRLSGDGYNAEVVNLGISGWGADQEVEVLRREGIRYGPDLVIMHFSTNDLTENLAHRNAGKFGRRKPFSYDLDAAGQLERRSNPRYLGRLKGWGEHRKAIIRRSEILKRGWWAEQVLKKSFSTPYRVSEESTDQLRVVTGWDDGDPFIRYLDGRKGRFLDERDIVDALAAYGREGQRPVVLRTLEDHDFRKGWSPSRYAVPPVDPGSHPWRLQLRLVEEARRLAADAGATFALLSDNEIGHYEWSQYWFLVAPDEETRRRYLEPSDILRRHARQSGYGYIENSAKVQRGRADAHPTVAGNRTLADSIHRYLMIHFRSELEAGRSKNR
jgi:hypothetical protein